ncbi:DUF3365 domain-containing protein [Telmatospirillum sp.]|uniref:Tll0287-like domain-containing protein n=1 Tax=Telmatospirillum sp. TaxID=2079197 RepID=UPI00283D3D00|nr:DUF3365 domain-containing protein [Telmatospirillum sp.]MDR3441001.1 DUF3365 domain-containing protein [Telmatospirillum sp.]
MRIEARFGLILAVCFGFGLLVAGYISYTLAFREARAEVNEKSRVLLEMGISLRRYTVEEIAPIVSALPFDGAFHPQMVPSYGAQSTLKRFSDTFPDYVYRESSLNPTNVADRAADWEVGLIRAFKKDPALKELSGETGSQESLRYFLARPLRMTSTACLPCHSTPAAAPKAMVEQYGAGNGFGWEMNDVIGVQIVEVPVLPTRAKATNSVLVTVGSMTCVFVLSLTIFLLLLRRYVTRPLSAITRSTYLSSVGGDGVISPETPLNGQFQDLGQAVHRLKVSLNEALRLFERSNGTDRDSR